jgi:hypothetical protein
VTGTLTGPQFLVKIAAASSALSKAQDTAVAAAALAMKRTIEASRNRAVGSDGRLSHVGTTGAKLGLGYALTGAGATRQALMRARGPWQLVEERTSPHTIGGTRSSARARRKRSGFLAFPDGNVRRSVHHPGTAGKHPWKIGVAAGTPEVVTILRLANVTAVTSVFR